MPSLSVGPILRHVGESDATVWVETDAACTVEVLGHRAQTFCVEGHHYAIVVVEGLQPGSTNEYEVRLDGRRAWPEAGSELPPSVIRTVDRTRPLRLAFGSCRVSAPHEPPYTHRRASDTRGFGVDALRTLALEAAASPTGDRPDALLLLGDQIYADEPPPAVREHLQRRHGRSPGSGDDALEDFEDYAFAYRDAWTDAPIRWLLSTVATSMIFDDHEIEAEWKISQAWVDDMRPTDWYDRRVAGGLMAYWLYQHLGNLPPDELAANEVLQRLRSGDDGGPVLREMATGADRQAGHSRWSFFRDFGRIRLIVVDTRAGRTLQPDRRRIVDPAEWRWVREKASGDYDHLLLASSVPFLLSHGLHYLEAWNEAVAGGAWGRRAARWAERIRRAAALDHWAAFQRSFDEFCELLEELTSGRLRPAPRDIVLLSGDVHHCYLARVAFRPEVDARAPVWQAVCSGLRKPLAPHEKVAMRTGNSRAAAVLARGLAAAAGLPAPRIGWRLVEGPTYANQVSLLDIGDSAPRLRVYRTLAADWRRPRLWPVVTRTLGPAGGTASR